MFMDSSGNDPVGEGDERQDKEEESAGLIIKEPADEEEIDVSQMQDPPRSPHRGGKTGDGVSSFLCGV